MPQCKAQRWHPHGTATIEYCQLEEGHPGPCEWPAPRYDCAGCKASYVPAPGDYCKRCREQLRQDTSIK